MKVGMRMNDDTISRKATIEAMEGVDWYHIDSDGQLTHGANSEEHEPLYKAKDVYKVLNDMPPAQPEPQSRMVFGYPLEYLVAFAEACRRAGVDESDLKTFANNCEFAYATMEEEHRQHINQVIEAFMGNAGGANASD